MKNNNNMKTSFLTLILLIGFIGLSAQEKKQKLTEKQVIEKSHIDFTKECIAFTIHGFVEIDGHTFLNDTCSHPIIYMADLEGVLLRDTIQKISYVPRKCEKPGCNVLHLEKKISMVTLNTYNDTRLIPLTTGEIRTYVNNEYKKP